MNQKGEGGERNIHTTTVHMLSFMGLPILCREIDFHPTLGSPRSLQIT